MNEPLYVSVKNAATMTTLSRATINRRIKDGTITSVRVAGRRLISRQALVDLLPDSAPTAPSEPAAVRAHPPGDRPVPRGRR